MKMKRARVLVILAGFVFTFSCASQHETSDVNGGREIGGVPGAPNVSVFRLKHPSPLTASQIPEFAVILGQIKNDQRAGHACAVKEYQDSLQGGGKTAPHLRVIFVSFNAREAALKELEGKISKDIEVIDGGAHGCDKSR